MKIVQVNTKLKTYPVFIGSNSLESLSEIIKKYNLPENIFIISDRNVDHIYGKMIRRLIAKKFVKKYFVADQVSERIKSFGTANLIFNNLYEEKSGKDTLILAIGGGSLGDLAGFVASTYMRGLPLIHIPTTLLSAVDSSIGGKTAVNFKRAKNLIGTFYQPSIVLIDTNFLRSLPDEQLMSGFGEVIKYSYLTDKNFYSLLLSDYSLLLEKDLNFLNKIIYECVKIKSAIISKDEYEITGLRKILNFGHTFAHAYESSTSYKIHHGMAVVAGIAGALFMSFEKGLIDESQLKFMLDLPLKLKPSIKVKSISKEDIYRYMVFDKKNRDGEIKFVLIKNFGEILIDITSNKKTIIKVLEKTDQIWFKRATAGL